MKQKHLVFLTFLLTHAAPVWGVLDKEGDNTATPPPVHAAPTHSPGSMTNSGFSQIRVAPPEVLDLTAQAKRLQQSIQDVRRATQNNGAAHKVIILGPTGSGKSTLLNYLAERPLVADARCRLNTVDPVPGSEIGHGGSQTTLPSPWSGHNVEFWDCPGFDDSRGAEQDIVNAFAIHQLFSGHVKVLLAVSELSLPNNRSQGFLDLLKYMTQIFPENQLENCLSLVFTQQGMRPGADSRTELQELLDSRDIDPKVRRLLEPLLAENSNRLVDFPGLVAAGVYHASAPRNNILQSIQALQFMEKPTTHFPLRVEARDLIRSLADNLNKDVKNVITREVPTVVQFCINQRRENEEKSNIDRLQNNLSKVSLALTNLQDAQNIADFATPFNDFFDTTQTIKHPVQTLVFLQTLQGDVAYAIGDWSTALQAAKDQIHVLLRTEEQLVSVKEENMRLERERLQREVKAKAATDEIEDLKKKNALLQPPPALNPVVPSPIPVVQLLPYVPPVVVTPQLKMIDTHAPDIAKKKYQQGKKNLSRVVVGKIVETCSIERRERLQYTHVGLSFRIVLDEGGVTVGFKVLNGRWVHNKNFKAPGDFREQLNITRAEFLNNGSVGAVFSPHTDKSQFWVTYNCLFLK